MIKIVHICMSQYSDGWTYQENMLTKYHRKEGNDVTIITSEYCYNEGKLVKDDKETFIDCNGCWVIRLKRRKKGIFGKMPRYENFYATLEMCAPDIIFSHGCQYVDIKYVKRYVEYNKDVKLYIDNHADFSNSATNWVSKNVLHKVIWKHYAQLVEPVTQKFWGVLPARVDFLIDVYELPKEKCDLLVMGGDDEKIGQSNEEDEIKKIRHQWKVKDDDFLIVTGGKIDKAKKDTLLLMEAVKKIDMANVKLLVFGSIDDDLKKTVNLLVDDNKIQLVGWIQPDQSYNYFAAANLVVFPGRHSVFWEQVAAQGIPMLVKEWDGTKHIDVCGNVIFLSNVSTESIKNEILMLVKDKDKYNIMKLNAIKTMNYFSYKEIAIRSIS